MRNTGGVYALCKQQMSIGLDSMELAIGDAGICYGCYECTFRIFNFEPFCSVFFRMRHIRGEPCGGCYAGSLDGPERLLISASNAR